ncbi:hypothetical protein ET445_00525 [Agromyces protaetiae]|uniref:Glyoxalase-like domain-containing protein n=1 Tax=Agromyces protaetiae TaxID=2509455 RepID=A0A4P6FED0_9MICO|nr:VOC family protein [Agromyces protaetiae]QAY72037.1 hypothetical protein ET445_00525 [Agromyces protaetiae]
MSKQGWADFLAARDRADWVVLHGGATAVFRTASMADAAALAAAIVGVPGFESAGGLLTIAGARLTVRLTRDVYELEPEHQALAQAVSEVGRGLGASADRSAVREVQFAIAAKPDDADLGFWRAALGYDDTGADSGDTLVDPIGVGSAVWMQHLPTEKALRHAMHIDVSLPREEAEGRLAAALAAGGRLVHESDDVWILADRAGNKVCICPWPDGE